VGKKEHGGQPGRGVAGAQPLHKGGSKARTAGVRGQGSGVRGQGSGARGQGLGVSGVKRYVGEETVFARRVARGE